MCGENDIKVGRSSYVQECLSLSSVALGGYGALGQTTQNDRPNKFSSRRSMIKRC